MFSTLSAFYSLSESILDDWGEFYTIEELSTKDLRDPISSVILEKNASILLSSAFY